MSDPFDRSVTRCWSRCQILHVEHDGASLTLDLLALDDATWLDLHIDGGSLFSMVIDGACLQGRDDLLPLLDNWSDEAAIVDFATFQADELLCLMLQNDDRQVVLTFA